MQVPKDVAMGTIRLSTGRFITEEEIIRAAALIIENLHRQLSIKSIEK
jgi:cysteine sulfinate desulfinase/cysteine desulfurase-like protein